MSYAQTTDVSIAKSKAEIETMLLRAGATKFMSGFDENQAAIMFWLRGKAFKFVLPIPDRNAKEFHVTGRWKTQATPDQAFNNWEQACRSQWRALALAIKAKLVSVEQKIATFEQEFLSWIVTDDGRTVGERVIPQIEESAASGRSPRFLLTMQS